jgi:hypothetical protein
MASKRAPKDILISRALAALHPAQDRGIQSNVENIPAWVFRSIYDHRRNALIVMNHENPDYIAIVRYESEIQGRSPI